MRKLGRDGCPVGGDLGDRGDRGPESGSFKERVFLGGECLDSGEPGPVVALADLFLPTTPLAPAPRLEGEGRGLVGWAESLSCCSSGRGTLALGGRPGGLPGPRLAGVLVVEG